MCAPRAGGRAASMREPLQLAAQRRQREAVALALAEPRETVSEAGPVPGPRGGALHGPSQPRDALVKSSSRGSCRGPGRGGQGTWGAGDQGTWGAGGQGTWGWRSRGPGGGGQGTWGRGPGAQEDLPGTRGRPARLHALQQRGSGRLGPSECF